MADNSLYISMYPRLSSASLRDAGMTIHLAADYDTPDGVSPLEIKDDYGIAFDDPCGVWSIEDNGINFKIDVTIEHPKRLFLGSLNHMVDQIALAVRLKSRDSLQRMVSNSQIVIDKETESVHDSIDLVIKLGILRSSAKVELIAYVSKATEESNLPKGVILGTLWIGDMLFSGEGTDFPITTVTSEEDFLWKLEFYDESEPGLVRFYDSFALIFNEKHPYYKKLDLNKSPMDSPLFQEILAEAVYILVSHVKSLESGENGEDSCEPGSLSDAVHYMMDTYIQHSDDTNRQFQNIHNYIWHGGQ